MSSLASQLAALFKPEPSQTVFLTADEHHALESTIGDFLEQPNSVHLIGRVFADFTVSTLNLPVLDASRNHYIALYFALCSLRAYPLFLHPNDSSESLMRRFQSKKKLSASNALSDVGTAVCGGFEVLEDFFEAALSALEFIRSNAFSTLCSSFNGGFGAYNGFNGSDNYSNLAGGQRSRCLFSSTYLSEINYDSSLFAEECDFNADRLLSHPLKCVYHVALDVLSEIRSRSLVRVLEGYIFDIIQRTQHSLEEDLYHSKIDFATREYSIPYYIFKTNIEILIAGGVLSAIGSNYAAAITFFFKMMQQEGSTKAITKEPKEVINEPVGLGEALEDFESTMMTLFTSHFHLQNAEIGIVSENKNREISSIEDILMFDAFHYLFCELLMPLLANLEYYQQYVEGETDVFTYAQFIRIFNFESKFEFFASEADVTIRRSEQNKQFQLNYLETYYFLLVGKDACKEVFERHTVSEFLLAAVVKTPQMAYEPFFEKFEQDRAAFDQPIFEMALILFLQFTTQKKDIFTPLIEAASSRGKAICAWLAIFRSIHMLFNYIYIDRSCGLNILYSTPRSHLPKQYNEVQRNSYFPGEWYCFIGDNALTPSKTTEEFNELDIYLESAMAGILQIRELLIPIITNLLRPEIFTRICSLALSSVEYSFELIEGFLLTLGSIGYFRLQKMGYATMCAVFCVIFAEESLEVEEAHLLRLLASLAPEMQFVLFDVLGSYALGNDAGSSLVMEMLLNESIQQQDKDYDHFNRLISEMANEQFFCDRRTPLCMPFDFLCHSSNCLKRLKTICDVMVRLKSSPPNYSDFLQSNGNSKINTLNVLTTASWILAYILGSTSRLGGDTLCLKQLNLLLKPRNNLVDDFTINLAIYERTSSLKRAFLTMFKADLPINLTKELQELGIVCQPIESHFDIDAFGVSYEEYGVFENVACSQLLVSKWFISSIMHEINSGIYETKFFSGKCQLRRQEITSELITQGAALASLNANYLLRSSINIENINEISMGEIAELILFSQEGYFIVDGTIDLHLEEKMLTIHLLIMYAQLDCQRFIAYSDATMSKSTFICKKLVRQIANLVFEVTNYYWELSTLKRESECNVVSILMEIICSFVREYRQCFTSPLVWRNVHEDKMINYYPIIVDALARLYSLSSNDWCREITILALRDLMLALNTSDISSIDFYYHLYDFEFIYNIHIFNHYTRPELLEVLSSPYIRQTSLQELLHYMLRLDGAVNNGRSLVDDLITTLLLVQDKKVINKQRPALSLSPGLLFIFSLCPRYKEQATQLFRLTFLQKQKIGCTPHEIQVLQDLITIHNAFSPSDYESAMSALAPFGSAISEMQGSIIQALQYIFNNIELYSQPAAGEFIDIILDQIELVDALFAAEVYAETGFFQDIAINKQQLFNLTKPKKFSTPQLFSLLFPMLLRDFSNADFLQTQYCHQDFQKKEAVKYCICLQMLYLANPHSFFEEFCEKSLGNATENAFALFAISLYNTPDDLIFYEYLFKHQFSCPKDVNSTAAADLLYDNFLDGFDDRISAFGAFRSNERDETAIFREFKNNINTFVFAGITSLIVYYLCNKTRLKAMIEDVRTEFSRQTLQNDICFDMVEFNVKQPFIMILRACLDYTGCEYTVGQLERMFSHPVLSEYCAMTEMLFKQTMSSCLRLENDFLAECYCEGNAVVKRIQKPLMDRQFIEQTFPSPWTEYIIKNVDNLAFFVERGIVDDCVGSKKAPSFLLARADQEKWDINIKFISAIVFMTLLYTLKQMDRKCSIECETVMSAFNIIDYLVGKVELVPPLYKDHFLHLSGNLMIVLSFDKCAEVFCDAFAKITLRIKQAGIEAYIAAHLLDRYAENPRAICPELVLVRAEALVRKKDQRAAYKVICEGSALVIVGKEIEEEVMGIQVHEPDFNTMFDRLLTCLLRRYDMEWLSEMAEE